MATFNLNTPNIPDEADILTQVRQIRSYITNLNNQLRYDLSNIDEDNLTGGELPENAISRGFRQKVLDLQGNMSVFEQTATRILTRITDAEGNITELEQIADGIILAAASDKVYRAATEAALLTQLAAVDPPVAMSVGLLWLDTTTMLIKRCKVVSPLAWEAVQANEVHTSFIDIQDDSIDIKSTGTINIGANAKLVLSSADRLETTAGTSLSSYVSSAANGRSKVYSTTWAARPTTGVQVGDLLICSDTDPVNKLYRWNGTGWEDARDGSATLAEQTDTKFKWIVSGGTSASTMVLTNDFYEVVADKIDLSANDSIKLTVSSLGEGGTNLIPNSDFQAGTGAAAWAKWTNYSGATLSTSAYSLDGVKNSGYVTCPAGDTEAGAYIDIPYSATFSQDMTLSFFIYLNLQIVSLHGDGNWAKIYQFDENGATLSETNCYVAYSSPSGWRRMTKTFSVLDTCKTLRIYFFVRSDGISENVVRVTNFQLERGTVATAWKPSPADPASGVKTSKIEIGSDFIDIESGGTLTLDAADDIKIGSGGDTLASTIDLSANDSIKLAVTNQSANLFPSDPSNWEQGTINEANGDLLTSSTRIRGVGYITLNAGTLYTVSRVKSLTGQIFLVYYNNSNAVIGHSGSWVATYPYSFSLPSGATKIRAIVRKADNGTIVPTDVPGILCSIVPAGVSGGVKTSKIDIGSDFIDISSGGSLNISADGAVDINGASVQIKAAEADNSLIEFGGTGGAFTVGRDGAGNFGLTLNTPNDSAIKINGHPVWHKGNIIIGGTQPTPGNNAIWLVPNTTQAVVYSHYVATKSGYYYTNSSANSYSLSAASSDTMSGSGTYTLTVKFTLRHYGASNLTLSSIGVTLTKGAGTVNMSYGAHTFYGWASKEIIVSATTTSTAFTSGTGVITCAIDPNGTGAFSSTDFLAHEVGTTVECTILGPGSSTAQLCQVYFVP